MVTRPWCIEAAWWRTTTCGLLPLWFDLRTHIPSSTIQS